MPMDVKNIKSKQFTRTWEGIYCGGPCPDGMKVGGAPCGPTNCKYCPEGGDEYIGGLFGV